MPSVNDKRARVKVQCIPLEFPASGSAKRWFLDSDCGKTMAADFIIDFTDGVYHGTVTANGTVLDNSNYFELACLKNNADIGVLMNAANSTLKSGQTNLINPGETMVFEPPSATRLISYINIYALSGTPNVEYYIGYKNA